MELKLDPDPRPWVRLDDEQLKKIRLVVRDEIAAFAARLTLVMVPNVRGDAEYKFVWAELDSLVEEA